MFEAVGVNYWGEVLVKIPAVIMHGRDHGLQRFLKHGPHRKRCGLFIIFLAVCETASKCRFFRKKYLPNFAIIIAATTWLLCEAGRNFAGQSPGP
jgi:hypothetical protein